MQHYGHSLQPQGTKASTRTMTLLYPFFPHGNRMGLPGGYYPFAVGGFRCVTDQEQMKRGNVMGAVKCSGWNPNQNAYQKPDNKEVANLPDGTRILVVNFPVTHRDFWKGSEVLVDFVRKILLEGGTVLFFDDLGKDRCISGLCNLLSRCTNIPAKEWLTTLILPQRHVDRVFYELVHHYNLVGAEGYAPKDYRSFILVGRIMDHGTGWAIFREAHPNTPYTPGGGLWTPPQTPGGRNARTPGGTDRNARRKEEEAGNVTPRECEDPPPLGGDDDEITHYYVCQGSRPSGAGRVIVSRGCQPRGGRSSVAKGCQPGSATRDAADLGSDGGTDATFFAASCRSEQGTTTSGFGTCSI